MKTSSKYDGSCKATTWLCGIAKRVLYKYYHKHPLLEKLFPEEAQELKETDLFIIIADILSTLKEKGIME